MSELLATTKLRIERDERVRLIGSIALTTVLAIAFLALLVSDQVQAAGV